MRFRFPGSLRGRGALRGLGTSRALRSRRSGKLRVWPLLVFVAFVGFYYVSNQQEVPLTGRTQLVDMTRAQEVALGVQSYRKILSELDVVSVGPEVEFVQEVAELLVPVVEEADFSWEFSVARSPEANAFALPGGKVVVYTGILPIVGNRDGLATVLGHEMAHAVARHGAERMAQQKLAQWAGMAVSLSVGEMEPATQRMVLGAFGVGSRFGVLLPFSRKHESEADYMGLIYLARACFHPSEAPEVWRRMGQHAAHRQLEILSTHPAPETRVQQFQQWMPEALAVRREYCSSRAEGER
ncbi:M48 family metallopeptidase [bacterium]|nr:M48 family metallopeptidase [bacterium]